MKRKFERMWHSGTELERLSMMAVDWKKLKEIPSIAAGLKKGEIQKGSQNELSGKSMLTSCWILLLF